MNTITVCESSDYMEIHDLLPYTRNPRIDLAAEVPEQFEDLKQSILHNGLFRPFIVFGRRDSKHFDYGNILGGNQRYKAIMELILGGAKTVLQSGTDMGEKVPVTLFVGSDENARRIVLRDNREQGDWDYPSLAKFFEERITEGTIDLTGFTRDEVAEIKELHLEGVFDEGYQSWNPTDDELEDDGLEMEEIVFRLTPDQNETLEECFVMLDGMAFDLENNSDDRSNSLEFICAYYLQQGEGNQRADQK